MVIAAWYYGFLCLILCLYVDLLVVWFGWFVSCVVWLVGCVWGLGFLGGFCYLG